MLYLDVYCVADVVFECILCGICCIWMYTVWQMLYSDVYCVTDVFRYSLVIHRMPGRCCVLAQITWCVCVCGGGGVSMWVWM